MGRRDASDRGLTHPHGQPVATATARHGDRWWPGSTSARGRRRARLAWRRERLPVACLKTPLRAKGPRDLLRSVLGIGAHTSALCATPTMLQVVSHRPPRAHDRPPHGRRPYRPSGHVLSLTAFANSIPSFSETVPKCLFNKILLSSVQNFAITIEKPICLQNCYENYSVSI